jgi:hypothetical protein
MRQQSNNGQRVGNPQMFVGNKQFHPLPVPEIIDLVFAKTSQNTRLLLSENERFGLVFVKTGSINSGTERIQIKKQ